MEKIKILALHSVPHYVKDGKIYADSMLSNTSIFEQVEDITEWSIQELYSWLGY